MSNEILAEASHEKVFGEGSVRGPMGKVRRGERLKGGGSRAFV